MNKLSVATGIVGLALASSVAACTNDTGDEQPASFDPAQLEVQQDIAAMLPSKIREAGTIQAATSATYPPMEYFADDNHTIIGADVDLLNAMAAVWGVEVDLVDVPFDQVLVGMEAGKYNLGMTPTIITADRLEVMGLVTYLQTGSIALVASGNPEDVDASHLCGHSVAVEKGSAQEQVDVPALSRECTENGDEAIDPTTFPAMNQMVLGLDSGRVEAVFTSELSLRHLAKESNGKYEVAGDPVNVSYRGLQVEKGSELGPAIVETLKYLEAEGVYDEVLDNWSIPSARVDAFEVATRVEAPSN